MNLGARTAMWSGGEREDFFQKFVATSSSATGDVAKQIVDGFGCVGTGILFKSKSVKKQNREFCLCTIVDGKGLSVARYSSGFRTAIAYVYFSSGWDVIINEGDEFTFVDCGRMYNTSLPVYVSQEYASKSVAEKKVIDSFGIESSGFLIAFGFKDVKNARSVICNSIINGVYDSQFVQHFTYDSPIRRYTDNVTGTVTVGQRFVFFEIP